MKFSIMEPEAAEMQVRWIISSGRFSFCKRVTYQKAPERYNFETETIMLHWLCTFHLLVELSSKIKAEVVSGYCGI